MSRSEDNSEGKLHRARTAHLVKWVQNTQRIRKRSRSLPKGRRAKAGIDSSEVGMVEDIKSLCAKLQLQVFVNRKLATHSQVHLPCTESTCKVARSITKAGIYSGKGIGIDSP